MFIGKTQFIVKTLKGDVLQIRNSIQFAQGDAINHFKTTGEECMIIEVIVSAIMTMNKETLNMEPEKV